MSLKRLVPLVVLACVAGAVLVSGAPAGDFADDPCFDNGGGLYVCPPGTVGQPYSLTIKLKETETCQHFEVTSGNLPPGLGSINPSTGAISGVPTEAGNFSFYVTVSYPPDGTSCGKNSSDRQFQIPINPGVPKLTIGPESAPTGTVSTPYSLQMTATVADSKTWSIVDGALPPGLALGPSDGLISGTPTAAGMFTFTVRAAIADGRVDTKALGIVVRSPLVIAGGPVPQSEVGVRFLLPLTATGGSGTYAWSLTSGTLPAGVTLAPTGGIAGIPEGSGTYPFSVSVSDTEGRATTHSGVIVVADRLEILQLRLRPAKVGRFYQARLRTTGGVQPAKAKSSR